MAILERDSPRSRCVTERRTLRLLRALRGPRTPSSRPPPGRPGGVARTDLRQRYDILSEGLGLSPIVDDHPPLEPWAEHLVHHVLSSDRASHEENVLRCRERPEPPPLPADIWARSVRVDHEPWTDPLPDRFAGTSQPLARPHTTRCRVVGPTGTPSRVRRSASLRYGLRAPVFPGTIPSWSWGPEPDGSRPFGHPARKFRRRRGNRRPPRRS